MIRDGRYVAPDVIWTDPRGDLYAAHVLGCGTDLIGPYVVITFEDDEGTRTVKVWPSHLEVAR